MLSTNASGQQVLTWTGLGDSPATGANRTIVITFAATLTDPDAATNPGVGSNVPHPNTVSTTAQDATGATGNASGPYGGPPASVSTSIHSADLSIVKTSGGAVAGASITYILRVSNNGPDPAAGPITVVDTLPPGLGSVVATGDGWTCSTAVEQVECTRTAAPLASGASLPPITVVAAIPADTPDDTVLTNTATVAGPTFDPNLGNNTSTISDALDRSADLSIDKNVSGPVVAGEDVTFTLDVSNRGASDSAGPIVVRDTLPAGTAYRSATGEGWSCAVEAGALTCRRADGLANGESAPQITLVLGLAATATGQLSNTGTVSGPETDPNPGNNTSTVTVPIEESADLALLKDHVGEFVPGAQGVYTFTVTNFGPSTAKGPITISDTLADELTFVSDNSADWAAPPTPATSSRAPTRATWRSVPRRRCRSPSTSTRRSRTTFSTRPPSHRRRPTRTSRTTPIRTAPRSTCAPTCRSRRATRARPSRGRPSTSPCGCATTARPPHPARSWSATRCRRA